MPTLRAFAVMILTWALIGPAAAAQTVPDFSATPTEGPQALDVQFTNLTTSDAFAVAYTWDFGDGSPTSSAVHPLHVYTAPGLYTVTLKAQPVGQASVGITRTDFIAVSAGSLSVDFAGGPTTGVLPLVVRFHPKVGGDAGGVDLLWDFGDGAVSTASHPVHTYYTAGPHTVTLTATAGQLTAVASKADLVQAEPPQLQASFEVGGTPAPAGAGVRFTNTSTTDSDAPASWSWTFGDGSTSSLKHPVHKYAAPGVYDVSLTMNQLSETSSMTLVGAVTVTAPALQADFTATPNEGTAPLLVQFEDASTGTPPLQWHWDFGNGSSGSGASTTQLFTQPGTYDVVLTTSVGPFSDESTATISVVHPQLQAGLDAFPRAGLTPLAVQFTDLSSGLGDYTVSTKFGDGSKSDVPEPLHEYVLDGIYSVQQTVGTIPASSLYTDVASLPDAIEAVDPEVVVGLATLAAGHLVADTLLVTVHVGDLNGDGLPDLVSGNTTRAEVSLQQAGGFSDPYEVDVIDGTGLQLVDWDVDGDLDLFAFGGSSPPALELWPNDGAGQFGQPFTKTFGTLASVPWTAVLDVDEDGLPDVVLGGKAPVLDPRLRIVYGLGAAGFGASLYDGSIVEYDRPPRVADMNVDGHLDVVGPADAAPLLLNVLLGNGEVVVGPTELNTGFNGLDSWDLGEVTGDGHADVVVANTQGHLHLFEGSPDWPLAAQDIATPYPLDDIRLVDLDGDGRDDLSGITPQGRLALGRLTDAGQADLWSLRALDTLAGTPDAVWVDLEPDGDMDLLLPHGTDLIVRENLGIRGRWADVGAGMTGPSSSPRLTGHGELRPGTPIVLTLTDAAPTAASWLILGLSESLQAFQGGILVPQPDVVFSGLLTNTEGGLTIEETWPGVPGGTASWYQAWILDGAELVGSNGLLAVSVD